MHILRTLRRMLWCQYSQRSKIIRVSVGCLWTGKLDLNTDHVDVEICESAKNNLRIQKYSDTRHYLSYTRQFGKID